MLNDPFLDPRIPQDSDQIRDLMEAYNIGGFDLDDKYDSLYSSDDYEYYDSDNYGFDNEESY